MKYKIVKWCWLLITFIIVVFSSDVVQAGYVNIVNPVRISVYNPDPVASIKSQYSEINKLNLSSTLAFDL